VLYLTLAAIFSTATQSRPLKVFYVATGILVTLLVGVSRVYEGVHYPTDVLAGWMLGSAWALLCWVGAQFLLHRTSATTPPTFSRG
jgi:undecaprenyl-diphosphatase